MNRGLSLSDRRKHVYWNCRRSSAPTELLVEGILRQWKVTVRVTSTAAENMFTLRRITLLLLLAAAASN